MPDEREARRDVIEQVLADPPQVHPGAPSGVFRASGSCYEWLADVCRPGLRTLETGIGVSTVLFTAGSGSFSSGARPGRTVCRSVEVTGSAVGVAGFEPTAPRSQSECATKLRHTPGACRPLSLGHGATGTSGRTDPGR